MPLYEYQCDACGHRFEALQKFSDPPLETCPKCAAAVRKLIAAPAFQLKGTGWYVTDFARKPAPAPSADTAKTTDAAGESGKSAEKSAEKSGDGATSTAPAPAAASSTSTDHAGKSPT